MIFKQKRGAKVMAEKKYIIDNAELMAEWNWAKNNALGFDPQILTQGSHTRVWWICKKGHSYEAQIKNRVSGSSCPFCSNRKVQSGYNDLATTNPIIASEWNYEKNKGLLPTMVPAGSQKKVWWKCFLGHEWDATVVNRINGTGCPYCSNHKVLEGYNDLATTNPKLAIEWNYEKNKDLSPKMVVPGSLKKVWWKCSHGHEWQETVVKRTARGYNCPFCSSHKVLAGFNDLATKHPDVAKEWHPTKNGSLTPCEVSASSKKKAWWICSKGHEWQAAIGSRTDLRAGCPICNQEMKTSFPEQAILFYLRKITSAESRNNDFGKEIDVYLPEYKIGIEHNGKFYHKDKKEADKQKILFFVERNIRIITVAEGYRNTVHNDIIEYEASTNKESLNWAIRELLKKIGLTEMHIDVENDASEIYSQYIIAEKENSLAVKLPEIAQEWNYEKNGLLTPEMISNASGKKVWWKCSKGHEWQATVNDRKKGYGCKICGIEKAKIAKAESILKNDENTLFNLFPELISEWDYQKNTSIDPKRITARNNRKVWWKCSICGFEWETAVSARTSGSGCPKCAKEKARTSSKNTRLKGGKNTLMSCNPQLCEEWDYQKNEITPEQITPKSNIKVFWICKKCNNSWLATVHNRTNGSGCPQCAKEKRKKTT